VTIAWSESERLRLSLKTGRLTETETGRSLTKVKEVFCRDIRFQTFEKDLDCSNHMQTELEAK